MPRSCKSAPWSPEQIALITALYPQFPSKRWKNLAHELTSRGYPRTETECREKWVNFLAPGARPREWEAWELQKMYELHANVGSRWCVVQQAIGRTQNCIKNRFYGTLRNFIRGVLSHFQSYRCFNAQISRLSPNYLNSLYAGQESFHFMGSEVRNTIANMAYKVNKAFLVGRITQEIQLYAALNMTLLRYFQEKKQSVVSASEKLAQNQQQPNEQQDIGMRGGEVTDSLAMVQNSMWMGMYPFMDINTGIVYWLQ